MRRFNIYFLLIVLFWSCVPNMKKDKVQYLDSIIKETIGEELLLPEELILYEPFSNYSMDSCDISIASHKIYTHINVSCGSCLGEIKLWEELIPQFEKLGVPIIMICVSDDEFILFEYLCEENKFENYSFPFFFDKNDEYVKLNIFMEEDNGFKTVLTDKENNILLLGNPINSIEIKELFLEKVKPN